MRNIRAVALLALLALGACGGAPAAGPSPVADAPSSPAVNAPRPLPAGLDPAYVRTIAIIDEAGRPKRWEGGPFHHCIAAGVDAAVIAAVAARMSEITGIPRTDAGPCNVSWRVEGRAGLHNDADTTLYGSSTAIVKAEVRFQTERGVTMANATHESGHVLGLAHSLNRPGDSMCEDTISGPERNLCAPFPDTFSPSELAVLAWIYAPSGK